MIFEIFNLNLLRCTFNEEKCDLKKDFIKQRTSYGVCYTFNSGKNNTVKQTTIPGYYNKRNTFFNLAST